MLFISTNDLSTYKIHAIDEMIGDTNGFLFAPNSWEIKYLIAKRGLWPFDKEFYIPTDWLGTPDNVNKIIPVGKSIEDVESIRIPVKKMITSNPTNEHPIKYWRVGKFPFRIPWLDPFAISSVFRHREERESDPQPVEEIRPELRNLDEVTGYRVDVMDKEIGDVDKFIIDVEDWIIRYVIVKGAEEQVLLPSQWVNHLNPVTETLKLNLLRESVLDSPYVIS